jgi:hypothetical protein
MLIELLQFKLAQKSLAAKGALESVDSNRQLIAWSGQRRFLEGTIANEQPYIGKATGRQGKCKPGID